MTTTTLTLVAFLTARLDEDEAAGKAWEVWLASRDWPTGLVIPEWYGVSNPARVLREVEAKRAIVALHRSDTPHSVLLGDCVLCADEEQSSEDSEGGMSWYRAGQSWPCATIRALAAVYADHPDYREEWRT